MQAQRTERAGRAWTGQGAQRVHGTPRHRWDPRRTVGGGGGGPYLGGGTGNARRSSPARSCGRWRRISRRHCRQETGFVSRGRPGGLGAASAASSGSARCCESSCPLGAHLRARLQPTWETPTPSPAPAPTAQAGRDQCSPPLCTKLHFIKNDVLNENGARRQSGWASAEGPVREAGSSGKWPRGQPRDGDSAPRRPRPAASQHEGPFSGLRAAARLRRSGAP